MQTIAEQLREEGIKIGEKNMQTFAQQLKKEGKKEGMEKKAKETAKKMLEDGLPIETILKYTGLTEKEVKELMS